MKKNNRFICIIIFAILIAIYSASIVEKLFKDNDTFFTIAVGNKILEQGIYEDEDFTWHEGLKYQNVRWIFDIIVAKIYNTFSFLGVYVFVMIITALIGLSIYYILIRKTNSITISTLSALLAMYSSNNVFCGRAQILSFLIFVWEYYFIYCLLKTGKKRYGMGLLILAILLANVHASVFPLYFVFFVPYLAEYYLGIFLKISDDSKISIEKRSNILMLTVVMIISIFCGLLTPLGEAPYVNLFKTVNELSTVFISEMQPVNPTENTLFYLYIVVIIGIIGFTKIKPNVADLFYILGFGLLSISTTRSLYFFYLIGIFPMINILMLLFDTYEIKINLTKNVECFLGIILFIMVLLESVNNYSHRLSEDYVNTKMCPVDATTYIINNIDLNEMRLFNHFNLGGYMEFRGVPVFLDSRAEIYLSTFNNTTILQDWYNACYNNMYSDIFSKYGITHAILYNSELINKVIKYDNEWKMIYRDSIFSIYEKIDK